MEEAGIGNAILAFIFAFFLYMCLLMIGSMTMQAVLDAKNSRVVEILLSSVHSSELLAGKILGIAITSGRSGCHRFSSWRPPTGLSCRRKSH